MQGKSVIYSYALFSYERINRLEMCIFSFLQECPPVDGAAAVKGVFNPCPGKDHLLTLLFTENPDHYFLNFLPFPPCFLAVYDTVACQYILTARDKCVASNIIGHTRDGALLFVRSYVNHRIELLNSESLEVHVSVAHDVGFLRANCWYYRLLCPFFPMMTADNSMFAVLNATGHRSKDLGPGEPLTVSVYSIPLLLQKLSLKDVCRRHIRALVPCNEHVQLLNLPKHLHEYLLWHHQYHCWLQSIR